MDWILTKKKPLVKKPFSDLINLLDEVQKNFVEARKEIKKLKNEPVPRT